MDTSNDAARMGLSILGSERPSNPQPPQLTVAVVSHNDGELLASCLASAAPWADHLLLLDMQSTDNTCAIALEFGATVIPVPHVPIAEQIRQAALEHSPTDWLVFLDPDESAAAAMGDQCRAAIMAQPAAAAFRWPFLDTYFGTPLSSSRAGARKLLVVHRTRVRFASDHKAHEEPSCVGEVINLPREQVQPIVHRTFRSVPQITEKLTRYAATGHPLQAHGLLNSDLLLPRLLARHLLGSRAWRDGRAGVEAASLSALHDYVAALQLREGAEGRSNSLRPSTRLSLNALHIGARLLRRIIQPAKAALRWRASARQYQVGP